MSDTTAGNKLRNEIREAYMTHTGNSEVDYASREWLDFEGGWLQCLRATPAPQAAPSGYVLMPLVATPEMLRHTHGGQRSYAAMIAAAPAVAITQAATSGPVHELDAAMSLLRVARTVNAAKVQPVALRKQVAESVSRAAGADGEGDEYIYADVYGHLCELIEPYVLSDERPEGYPFTASVTDTMSMLIEYYQRAHLAGTTPNMEAPSVKTWHERMADKFGATWRDEDPIDYLHDEIRDLRECLSAQQAGVQEAPSEDAKEPGITLQTVAASLQQTLHEAEKGRGSYWINYDAQKLAGGIEAVIEDIAALAAATQTEKK